MGGLVGGEWVGNLM